jgi:predicted AAA+ superfamily ATPase
LDDSARIGADVVRNLPVFSAFLNAAALSDRDLVNFANIARDCGVSGHTVKGHFGILEDTLLGRWLPAYTRRPKRRVVAAPKFFISDVGVVNHLARRSSRAISGAGHDTRRRRHHVGRSRAIPVPCDRCFRRRTRLR